MSVGTVVAFEFFILEDISHLHVSELHALNGVPVAGLAVAQSGGSAATQNIVYPGFIVDTGGYIRAVPNAVLFGIGQVVFVDGQRASLGFVNGRHIGQLYGGGSHREGQEQGQNQNQGKNLCNSFHKIKHFLSLM